jgi:hypothetical protein
MDYDSLNHHEHHHHHHKSRIWTSMLSWKGIGFHIAGIAAIIWLLLRSGTGPQRIQYPCQQASLTIATGYITFWTCLLTGLFIWIRSAKTRITKTIPTIMAACLMVSTISTAVFATLPNDTQSLNTWTPIPKQPIGTPVGLNPGRVTWIWDPNATAQNLTGYWWEEQNNNQTVLDQMFTDGICDVTGFSNITNAWNALFHDFNNKHGDGDIGYTAGEKIAIKINLNNAMTYYGNNYRHEDNDRDASPYVVKALLHQLVDIVGVSQDDITVFDASREMPNCLYNRIYYKDYPAEPLVPEFPDIHYADMSGGAAGREKVVASQEYVYVYNASGLVRTLPTCVADAKYLFDMPLLKRHPVGMGVTLSGKNLYGSFIEPVADGLHQDHVDSLVMGNPAPQTDLLADSDLGGKILLYVGDGTFATKVDHKTIAKFLMFPFNNDWMNSLFFSQDPIAMDSVMYDFLYAEGTDPCEASQNYLHQAAMPPAGLYDPEGDGTFLNVSLGVHEHADLSVSVLSPDRYSGPANNGIDYQPVIVGHASPAVVLTAPLEHHAYIGAKDIAPFPFTLIVGKSTVAAQVNGDSLLVQKVEFSIDGKVKSTDTQAPFTWQWNTMSLRRHTLTVTAFYTIDNVSCSSSSSLKVWKLL